MTDLEIQVHELLAPHSVAVRDLVEMLRKVIHTTAPTLTEEVKMG